MAAERARRTLTDALRETVGASGQTVYAVAKRSGIAQPVLHRFMAGKRGLTLTTAERLCAYLGLELRPAERAEVANGVAFHDHVAEPVGSVRET